MFALLRQIADGAVADAFERLVADAPDRKLVRINALAFAAENGLGEERDHRRLPARGEDRHLRHVVERALSGLRRRARFEHDAEDRAQRRLCLLALRRRLRADARRDGGGHLHGQPAGAARSPRTIPETMPPMEYFRQLYFSSELDLPEDFEGVWEAITLESLDLPPGEKAIISLQLPAQFIIVFDPITHTAQFLDVKGEPTKERQALHADLRGRPCAARDGRDAARPAPPVVENRTDRRLIPSVFIADDDLHDVMAAAPAVPDREAAPLQPDLPRHLSHRHARHRSAAEDHQPDLPLHRPARLDRALRAGGRPRRLRSRARAFRRVARDRRRGGGRRGEDDRRCGDGDLPDAGPRGRRGAQDARRDAQAERGARARGPAPQDRHPRRARASRSRSTSGRTISGRR